MSDSRYPLHVQSVGSDTYIVMSRGHHDFTEFMTKAVTEYNGWFLGGPKHVWIKTTPTKGGWNYNIVDKGVRGAWPATFCWEYADDYEEWQKLAGPEPEPF